MLDLKQDFFALFGLEPVFAINMERLEQAYLDIQGRVHPDRFAHLPDLEKRLSMQWATHANEAFRTLKSPLARGHYLLEMHLRSLVEIIEHGLVDEQQKVRTISALAIAALAEAATPYGIESFDSVLKPLWKGIRQHRGKGLAAFLKAIGYLIPLMDAEYANYYTREVMLILIREFQSPDEEMKKIVLKVVKQCCGTDGVEANYIKT